MEADKNNKFRNSSKMINKIRKQRRCTLLFLHMATKWPFRLNRLNMNGCVRFFLSCNHKNNMYKTYNSGDFKWVQNAVHILHSASIIGRYSWELWCNMFDIAHGFLSIYLHLVRPKGLCASNIIESKRKCLLKYDGEKNAKGKNEIKTKRRRWRRRQHKIIQSAHFHSHQSSNNKHTAHRHRTYCEFGGL